MNFCAFDMANRTEKITDKTLKFLQVQLQERKMSTNTNKNACNIYSLPCKNQALLSYLQIGS